MDHTVKCNSVELAQSFGTQVQPSASVFKLEDFWNTLHFLSNWPTPTLQRGRLSGESGISLRRARLCEEMGSSRWRSETGLLPIPGVSDVPDFHLFQFRSYMTLPAPVASVHGLVSVAGGIIMTSWDLLGPLFFLGEL